MMTNLDPVYIHPYIGSRAMGGKLCLINQKLREVWVCSGMSLRIWDKLRSGMTTSQIAQEFSDKYKVSFEKVQKDIAQFLQQLWEREIVELPDKGAISKAERAALVKELPHNLNGRMYEIAVNAKTLFRVWLDLLIPCNLRCRHCYLDFSEKDIVPLKDVCNYLDQLAEHGCPEVVLTGGEIFLRKDLLEIVAHAERKGFLFELYTNANYINKEKADQLSKYLIGAVQISIYGTTAPVHEAITRERGTFEKSINAAKLLIERGIPVRLEYHIQNDNFEDAFRFPEFATSLGADYKFDSKLVPNRNGSTEPLNYGVSLHQQAEIYKAGLLRREPNFVCTAAISKARISARGDIYPCELMNTVVVGNLRKQTLAEIWASQRRENLRHEILDYKPTRCGSCSHVSDCEPCAAMRGFGHDGHMEAPVSEACVLTTASLIAQDRLELDSPFQALEDDSCMSALLSEVGQRKTRAPFKILNNRVNIN
ncbi:MAG: PqqD family peptide modification chaperone [Blastocatellia bacterium]|nr:PqqD family peptide modification chaperone [Blastocatellia bacterium]